MGCICCISSHMTLALTGRKRLPGCTFVPRMLAPPRICLEPAMRIHFLVFRGRVTVGACLFVSHRSRGRRCAVRETKQKSVVQNSRPAHFSEESFGGNSGLKQVPQRQAMTCSDCIVVSVTR